jgi:Fe-S-cluster-containing dehydrogenase component
MELYFDADLCINCGSCEIACARENRRKKIKIELFDAQFPISSKCVHCEESPCIKVCPTEAIEKRNGVVYINDLLCIGCKSCVLACPFGVIDFEKRQHISSKCDLCAGWLEENKRPPCAETCPTGAIRYCERAEIEEITKKGRRKREMIGAKIYAWRPG